MGRDFLVGVWPDKEGVASARCLPYRIKVARVAQVKASVEVTTVCFQVTRYLSMAVNLGHQRLKTGFGL